MIEPSLRKWHRWLGITIVLFVIVQTLTGLILNLEDFLEAPAVSKWASLLHRGLGEYGTAYRHSPRPGTAGDGLDRILDLRENLAAPEKKLKKFYNIAMITFKK